MIKIIAHRGFWIERNEKNTIIAFTRALDHGFGIELDLRDCCGELIIEHDLSDLNSLRAFEVSRLLSFNQVNSPIALNIKSDGLIDLVHEFITNSKLNDYFVFDMSIPDMRSYLNAGINTFTRASEHEINPIFLSSSSGVWIDSFFKHWYDVSFIQNFINLNMNISIVSPELHGRPHQELWKWIKNNQFHEYSTISICTDFPLLAEKYFYAKN